MFVIILLWFCLGRNGVLQHAEAGVGVKQFRDENVKIVPWRCFS